MKIHLRCVVSTHKLTFEEFTTILTQIESCLNSRPLVPLQCDEDGIEALTPGHFLSSEPPESIPDPAFSNHTLSPLRRWPLCQVLVRHFWQRWSTEYKISQTYRSGQTTFSKWLCQEGATTHVHRQSNHCRPDRTRQVAVSGRSRDTCSQAVKSLPARPHSAGRRVREEPRHTYTGGQIPAGQTALGRSPCQGGAVTHVHRRSNPCRPDRTRQVAVSGRSRDTRTQAVIPAGQTALGRSPCQGGAATHVHRRSNPCQPDHFHSAPLITFCMQHGGEGQET